MFIIKMSKNTDVKLKDCFDFVVSPLEGLWWASNHGEFNYTDKSAFNFKSHS